VEVVAAMLRLQLQVAAVAADLLVAPLHPLGLGHQVQVVKGIVVEMGLPTQVVLLVEVVPAVLVLMVLLELV
jgi:hypothetical protein